MLINFNKIEEMTIPGMNGGTGTMAARMFVSDKGKIIPPRFTRAVRLACMNSGRATISIMSSRGAARRFATVWRKF